MPIVACARASRPTALALLLAAALVSSCGTAPSAAPSSAGAGGATSSIPGLASGAASGPPPTCPPLTPTVAPGPWSTAVAYEAFVRSFSDSNGDGIGDLAGLTGKLDYLNDGKPGGDDLGVSAVWLMPVAEAGSYHGYDVLDYDHVERDYGSDAEFRTFVDAAHARGIRVIVDFVVNHTSAQHPWFRDALANGPHRDWYVWSPSDPGWPSVNGADPWHAASGAYYYGVFGEGMPDLNLRNPAVTAEIDRVARHWLVDFDVDGFRMDAVPYLVEDGPQGETNTAATKEWLASFRTKVHAIKPEALVLGEVWDARATSAAYTVGGSLDMAFDFDLATTVLSSVRTGDGPSLISGQAEVATRYAPGLAGAFLTNHDQPRAMTQLADDADAARQAAETLLTGPGVPFVYYGEELGMTGSKPDERIRTPFPWTSTPPGFGFTSGTPWEDFAAGAETANVAAESGAPTSLLSTYRELIRLRAAHRALGPDGTVTPVAASRVLVAASIRSFADERLLVLQNLGKEPIDSPTLDLAAGPLCGAPTSQVVYADPGSPEPKVAAPVVTATGGFAGYVPLAQLPPRSTYVVRLSP